MAKKLPAKKKKIVKEVKEVKTATIELRTDDEVVMLEVNKTLGPKVKRRIKCRECGFEKIVESNNFDALVCSKCKKKNTLNTFGIK